MPFHRFTDPSYNLQGGVFPGPVGSQPYDRANVVSAGTGTDGSAMVDNPPMVGPNAGTYFVQFGEDATSRSVNRGLKAVCDNTDALDDIVRGSISVTTHATVVLSVPSSDLPVPGSMFVCEFGAVSTEEKRASLVHIENADGTSIAIITGSGSTASVSTPVCTLIHNGSGSSVVGTIQDGFFSGAVARFDKTLPVGAYVVYFGKRSCYARVQELEPGAFSSDDIANRDVISKLWNSFAQGLNEKYRRSTTRSADTTALNTPGSGAEIVRDGKAITVYAQGKNWEASPAYTDDPLHAAIMVSPEDWQQSGAFASSDPSYSGHIGYAFLGGPRTGSADRGPRENYAAALAHLKPVDMSAPTDATGDPYYTYIKVRAPAVLNIAGQSYGGGGGPGGMCTTVQLSSPYFFKNTSGKTALLVGIDILVIETQGADGKPFVRPFVFVGFDPNNRALIATTDGLRTNFPNGTPCFVTWFQTISTVGGSDVRSGEYGNYSVGLAWSPILAVDPYRLRKYRPAKSGARQSSAISAVSAYVANADALRWPQQNNTCAIRWGETEENGNVKWNGFMYGDGTVRAQSFYGHSRAKSGVVRKVNTSTSIALSILGDGHHYIQAIHAADAAEVVLNLITSPRNLNNKAIEDNNAESGLTFTILIHNMYGGRVSLTFDPNVIFSGGVREAKLPSEQYSLTLLEVSVVSMFMPITPPPAGSLPTDSGYGVPLFLVKRTDFKGVR